MTFKEIPGHETVKQRLRDMADADRMPHALVLEGPPGIGKLAMARALAAYIHCSDRTPDGDSCGRCPSCLQHRHFNHIDTHYVYPVIKGGNDTAVSEIYRDRWREFCEDNPLYADSALWSNMLNRGKTNTQPVIYVDESASLIHKISLTARVSRYKTVIFWLPERMRPEAANKLLKAIEEPYADTLFIFVSDSPADILPTIYSRIQRISMHALSDEQIADMLTATHGIDPTDAMAIAHIAEGNAIQALQSLKADSDRARYFDFFVQLMRLAYQRDVAKLKLWGDDLAAEGRDRQVQFYAYAMRMIRENFIYNFAVQSISYLDRKEAAFGSRFARFITERNAQGLNDTFSRAATDIAGNANAKIVNMDVAVKTILYLKNH